MTSRSNSDGSSVLDRSHSNQKPLEDHELDTTCRTVDDVFHFRTHYCRSNPDFRHFNWSGEPASTRSATLPAEFLAIILSNPKALDPNKGLRIPSVLRRASKFIDSVVVNLANTDEGLLSLRGPQLQHAATGYVRCPSTHGWWLVESREDHDLDLDTSNSAHYLMSNLAIANGFTRGRIRTASGWAKTRQDIFTVRSKPRPPRRRHRTYCPSPLSQVWLVSDAKPDIIRKPLPELPQYQVTPASEERVRLPTPPSQIPSTDAQHLDLSRDPNLHCSFLYPAARPRWTIRKVLSKVRRKMRKMFSSVVHGLPDPDLNI
ncbi:hypothetical protein N7448_008510 [Penicillium atrosanguineum]|nr:uncharacterized protein N7443_000475 [Penicillium atrosanguineum]KAJ5127731.1 hypothetical protein N7448_008510 [Penicillium atrosanguineum]KAJ5313591.1 hypothetical protein N7443_000475 [Penicillium atrosanguineum]